MSKILRFKKQDLIDYTIKFMQKLGVPAGDAAIAGDILIEADLRGVSSHGLIRLSTYYGSRLKKGYMNPITATKIISETDATISFDGGNGLGQVNSHRAMTACVEKARKSNIAIATVNHSNHYGIAGYYAMMALESDMIGISMTNSQPLAAPTYGRTAVLGTNPIAVAVPSYNKYPYVLDMATSVVAIGKIKVFEKKGEKIPMGWGMDDQGDVTDDPKKVQSGGPGALLPLGSTDILRSYKGYGLALLVDILCGALSGAAALTDVGFPHEPRRSDVGHFFMAIKIDAFRPIIDFKKQIDYMVGLLKNSPIAAGQDEIYIAGEKEYLAVEENRIKGVPLLDKVVEEIKINGADIGAPFELEEVH
ncbi:MAG: Ldh family oxidoreductase [Actinomycetia bacterium]|nr:Ldh family oxidoreductase [Actinomycetes bacterium]